MKSNEVILRQLTITDLEVYKELNHPDSAFHKYNGPYFKQSSEDELSDQINSWRDKFIVGDLDFLSNKMIIADKYSDTLIGEVSWYWKSKETDWMEIGIVIFNSDYWGKSIGYQALTKWINHVFDQHKHLVRIGLTTWSGNERMMKLAEKLGLQLEACYRNARILNGVYYDSVSYGILKSEWNDKQGKENYD